MVGFGFAAFVIGAAQSILEDRGIRFSSMNGARYGYALFVVGGAAMITGALGPLLGIAQQTVDVVEAIGATLVGLSLLAFFLAYLDSTP